MDGKDSQTDATLKEETTVEAGISNDGVQVKEVRGKLSTPTKDCPQTPIQTLEVAEPDKSETPDVTYTEDFERESTADSLVEGGNSRKSDIAQPTSQNVEEVTKVDELSGNREGASVPPEEPTTTEVVSIQQCSDVEHKESESNNVDKETVTVESVSSELPIDSNEDVHSTSTSRVGDITNVDDKTEITSKDGSEPLKTENQPPTAKNNDEDNVTEYKNTPPSANNETTDDSGATDSPARDVSNDQPDTEIINSPNLSESAEDVARDYGNEAEPQQTEEQICDQNNDPEKSVKKRLVRSNSQVIEIEYRDSAQSMNRQNSLFSANSARPLSENVCLSTHDESGQLGDCGRNASNVKTYDCDDKQNRSTDGTTDGHGIMPCDNKRSDILMSGTTATGSDSIKETTVEQNEVPPANEATAENDHAESHPEDGETEKPEGGEFAPDDAENPEIDNAELNESRGVEDEEESAPDAKPEQLVSSRDDSVAETQEVENENHTDENEVTNEHAEETPASEEQTIKDAKTEDDEKNTDMGSVEDVAKTTTEESILSKQNAEKEAFHNLIEENSKLKYDCEQMNKNIEKMEGDYKNIESKMSELRTKNEQQTTYVQTLEKDIEKLKQGGDDQDKLRETQQRMVRLSKEDERKDEKIRALERQLSNKNKEMKRLEQQKNEEIQQAAKAIPESKACIIL